MIKKLASSLSYYPMEYIIKGDTPMASEMDLGFATMRMAIHMKENGLITSRVERVFINMMHKEISTKEIIKMALNMEKVFINMRRDLNMMVSGLMTRCMVKV